MKMQSIYHHKPRLLRPGGDDGSVAYVAAVVDNKVQETTGACDETPEPTFTILTTPKKRKPAHGF